MIDEVIGTLVGRWYVTVFGVTFLVLASRHLGWRKTGIYAAAAIAVGIGFENLSVWWGFPYTAYSFNEELRGEELFVGDVPLMVSLSYTFMAYFAFASARLIVAGPYRTRSRMPVLEYVVAVMLGVWAIWLVDPVSQRGSHYFLGDLFHYEGSGFWFGIPLGSQLGFTLTTVILVGVLTVLMRGEPAERSKGVLSHPRFGALGAYLGQVLFMATTAFVVARRTSDALVARDLDALAGSAILIGLPAALLVAVYWRSLTIARRPSTDHDLADRPGAHERS